MDSTSKNTNKESKNYYFIHNELLKRTLVFMHGAGLGRFWANGSGKVKTEDGRWVKFGSIGSPDIIGYGKDGRFIGVEIKTGESRQSKHQKIFQKVSTNHGCIYFIVRSTEDFKSLELIIKGEIWKNIKRDQ